MQNEEPVPLQVTQQTQTVTSSSEIPVSALNSKAKQDADIAIMQRLATTLSHAVQVLDTAVPTAIFVVSIPPDDVPVVTKHASHAEVAARIAELRQVQEGEEDTEKEYFVLIFQGSQWGLVKGRTWKLYDGKELYAVMPSGDSAGVDMSGSLREPMTLVDMLASDVTAAPVAADAAVSDELCDDA